MKKSVFLLLMPLLIAGCMKTSTNPRLVNINRGGCGGIDKNELLSAAFVRDTAYCTFDDSRMNLFVGINNGCCSEFATEANAEEGVITANITTTVPGLCDCICYYTYTFIFTGIDDNWSYVVYVDGVKKFSGKVLED